MNFSWYCDEVEDPHVPGATFLQVACLMIVDIEVPIGSIALRFVALYGRVGGRLVGPLPLQSGGHDREGGSQNLRWRWIDGMIGE